MHEKIMQKKLNSWSLRFGHETLEVNHLPAHSNDPCNNLIQDFNCQNMFYFAVFEVFRFGPVFLFRRSTPISIEDVFSCIFKYLVRKNI